jgi:hypothetical protein
LKSSIMRSVLAIVLLGAVNGALRGQAGERKTAHLTSTKTNIPSLTSTQVTERLTAAKEEIRRLESSPLLTTTTTTPSLVEVGVKRPGQGTPTIATKHVKSDLVYHQTKMEEKSLKQKPLPLPRFATTGATKIVPSFVGGANPYSQGNVYGRGYQDAMTPTTGTFANNYGPASGGPMGTQGYGSFPQQIDPRGFGGTYNFSTPYSSFFGDLKGKGISSEGFKYQVPYSNVHPMAPYSGNPFTTGFGPGGPYYQQSSLSSAGGGEAGSESDNHPMLQNYTQFGPHPFGPYGTMSPSAGGIGGGMAGRGSGTNSLIPSSYPLGHPGSMGIGGPMGPAGAMGSPNGMMMHSPFLGPAGMGMPGMSMDGGMSMNGGMMGGYSQPQYNPAFGMGMIPHLNNGNMFDPAFPAGNLGGNPRSAGQGMQRAWAMGMPGIAPTMNPTMALHHGLNLPGGMGQFHDPPMAHGFGQGCKQNIFSFF